MSDVAPGQVWRSNDIRDGGREVLVLSIDCEERRATVRNPNGRETKIKLDTFGKTNTRGFTFVKEVDMLPETIKAFIEKYGFSPTVRELAAQLDAPVPTVHRRLQALKKKKVVTWVEGTPRTLQVA